MEDNSKNTSNEFRFVFESRWFRVGIEWIRTRYRRVLGMSVAQVPVIEETKGANVDIWV